MSEERQFISDLYKAFNETESERGSQKDNIEFWYNLHGDCIEFQTVDEAIIADRIDDYLTIYRSLENREPIGFKIKGVRSLLNICGGDAVRVTATGEGKMAIKMKKDSKPYIMVRSPQQTG